MLAKKTLDIFVDESGNFEDVRDPSRYCVLTLVFHDSEVDFACHAEEFARGVLNLGADPETMSFHTAPLIRQEGQFSAMSRNMRGKIFYQMLALARKSDVRFASFVVDTAYVASEAQIVTEASSLLGEFVSNRQSEFNRLESVRVFYDAGQKSVTRILDSQKSLYPCPVEFVQGVRQKDHLLLQMADFLCTISLMERRLDDGIAFNRSEQKFFGSQRDFRRNVLRKIKSKELTSPLV